METHFDNQILEKDFGNSIEFVKWLFEKLLFIILYLFCNINQHSASRSLSCSQLIFSTKYYHNLLFIWKIAHKNIALGFFFTKYDVFFFHIFCQIHLFPCVSFIWTVICINSITLLQIPISLWLPPHPLRGVNAVWIFSSTRLEVSEKSSCPKRFLKFFSKTSMQESF